MQLDTRMSQSMTTSSLGTFPNEQSCQASCTLAVHVKQLCKLCGLMRKLALAFIVGVLQVEAMAQLGGLIMIDPSSEAAKNNFFFGGVDNCKWRRPVVPGDCLVGLTAHSC